jgi:deoxyribonuclease-4
MRKYKFSEFVVHCPYFINFGSSNNRIYYGSIAVVKQELERANLLGAKYVIAHLGSAKDVGMKTAIKQAQIGLKKILDEYKGKTQFLIEISAGAGEIIGDTFEELAEIMQPLEKFKTFGGICFDTQHAWASGYDITKPEEVLRKFNKIIGLKWLKVIHINDSKSELGSHKDQHTHIGEGRIGEEGLGAFLGYLFKTPSFQKRGKGEFFLILETEYDKVKEDIKILKSLRNKIHPVK